MSAIAFIPGMTVIVWCRWYHCNEDSLAPQRETVSGAFMFT